MEIAFKFSHKQLVLVAWLDFYPATIKLPKKITMDKKKKKTVWVLTQLVNDYDQHGKYLLAVFESRPTFQQLKSVTTDDDVVVGKLFRLGFSRLTNSDEYHLDEIEFNTIYQAID